MENSGRSLREWLEDMLTAEEMNQIGDTLSWTSESGKGDGRLQVSGMLRVKSSIFAKVISGSMHKH